MAVPVRADLIGAVDSLARRESPAGSAARRRAAPNCGPPCGRCRRARSCWRCRANGSITAAARLPRALIANARLHHNQFSRTIGRFGPQLLRTADRAAASSSPRSRRAARRAEAVARRRRRDRLAGAPAAGGGAQGQCASPWRRGSCARRAHARLARTRAARDRYIAAPAEAALARDGQLLAALSHRGVLARGFVLVRDLDGKPLRRAAAVSPGMRSTCEFSDGRVRARAEGAPTAPELPKRSRAKRRRQAEPRSRSVDPKAPATSEPVIEEPRVARARHRASHSGTRLSASMRAAALVPICAAAGSVRRIGQSGQLA